MLFFGSNPFSHHHHLLLLLPPLCLFISSTLLSFSHGAPHLQHTRISEYIDERKFSGSIEWNNRRFVAETSNSTFLILASKRTRRRDPSDDFKYYTGGWNITNSHYLYSVAFSAAPPFLVAVIWFLVFAICLCVFCIRHCCCRRNEPYGYSRIVYALSLGFLILFTLAAIAGAAVLYTGQEKFHISIGNTLDYVWHQAETVTVRLGELLKIFMRAKKLGVGQVSLPAEYQTQIDNIASTINLVANDFGNVTEKHLDDIRHFLDPMRLSLIIVAAVMLLLTLLGFLFSVLGLQRFVYCLVIIGWILVAGTFILSGLFLLVHNVVEDACVAMDEWLHNPTADSALEHILPKVDNKTSHEIMTVTKGISFGLVNLLNAAIANVSNIDFPPTSGPPLYYNQSGPLMPILCNPYNPDLTDRQCAISEVELKNANEVWRNYICNVSASGICTTPGRLTPEYYSQGMSAVNVSYGLYNESPFLLELIDSTFVTQTFAHISKNNCPSLSRYSKWTYAGFLGSSSAVLLSLIVWIVYARERRHRVRARNSTARPLGS